MFDQFYESAVQVFGTNLLLSISLLQSKSDKTRYRLVQPLLENLPLPKCNERIMKFKEKSLDKSSFDRMLGNEHFKKQHFSSALRLYTRSIAYAPQNSKALSLAFANRSAVLKQMGHLTECMNDIKLALANDFPTEIKFKLHYRNAECLMLLEKHAAATVDIGKAISNLAETDLSMNVKQMKLEEYKLKLEFCKSKCADNINELDFDKLSMKEEVSTCELCKYKMPTPSYGLNLQFFGVSNCIALKYTEQMGRHFVATRDIKPGDVVIIDTAYAAVLNTDNFYTHCNYCFHRSVSLLPCKNCTWAMYCCEKCHQLDAKSHVIECSLIPNVISWDMGELALNLVKIVSKTGITEIFEFLQNCQIKTQDTVNNALKGFTNGQYLSSDFNTIYHLQGNSELRSVSDLFMRSVKAWCLVKCFGDLLPDSETFGVLFLRLLQALSVNCNEQTENFKGFDGIEQEYHVGSAILPTFSLLSHSCDPNLSKVSNGITAMIYVLQPVKAGSEVTISYCCHFYKHSKPYRQERCLNRYQFTCKCKACIENIPTMSSLQLPLLPQSYNSARNRKICQDSISSVHDLWNLIAHDKEVSSKDAKRIAKHIKILSDAKATKCFHYHAYVQAYDHFLARQSCRYIQKYI